MLNDAPNSSTRHTGRIIGVRKRCGGAIRSGPSHWSIRALIGVAYLLVTRSSFILSKFLAIGYTGGRSNPLGKVRAYILPHLLATRSHRNLRAHQSGIIKFRSLRRLPVAVIFLHHSVDLQSPW